MDRRRRAPAINRCNQFFQHGRCNYGARCKFSHETSSSPAASPQASTPRQEAQNPGEDRLRAWKRLLNQSPSNPRASRSSSVTNQQAYDRFFKLALELMEGDVGASQETVKLMAKDDGLGFIKDLVERQIPEAPGKFFKAHLWLNQIQPMFQVLTHARVIDSNVLEQQIAEIYNFIQGIGGRRMRILFDFILDLLDDWSTLPMAQEDEYGIFACELSLSVLAKMIDCNTSNIVNDNFTQIVKRFGSSVQAATRSPHEFSRLQAQKFLQYLERRLGVGTSLTEAKKGKKVPVKRAEFIMRKDLPGRLSADGPRHDNDHDDICEIRILPTHQEITSSRNEYLPTTDSSAFHKPGINGRLDREFRLLREDTVGQLRDAVSLQLQAMRNHNGKKNNGNKTSLRTYAYEQASIVDIGFDRNSGMDLLVQFQQPISKKGAAQRRDWWESSKRLQAGGLVCIISDSDSLLFCVVGEATIVTHGQNGNTKVETENGEPSEAPSLADGEAFAYVHLHLAEACSDDIEQALRWFRDTWSTKRLCLVEFPRVLLPSFQHTLMALQRMSQKPNVPFDDLIAPTEQKLEKDIRAVDPPQYTTKHGFSFNLSCLTNDKTALQHSPRKPLDPDVLSSHSILDATQSSALLNTLSRRLALIQGPPGTGKSFTGEKIIKALLANKKQADLGPILCVCYTNHALDQLLVHLKRADVKIIRIGSRSKAEELEGANLRVVARTADRTKAEKGSLWELNQSRNEDMQSIQSSLRDLASCYTLTTLRTHLHDFHPQHHDALFSSKDEEGWEKVGPHNPGQLLNQWLRSGQQGSSPRNAQRLLNKDIWSMSNPERMYLYKYWLEEILDPLVNNIIKKYRSYEQTKTELDKVSRDVDLRCLHESDVVGVTTTGLARNIELLQKLRCKVMLCEEAGEVLEAHTLTALLPSVEHAILIGDHLQLRPQTVNYELQSESHRGAQYSLDTSLFERLIRPSYDTDPKLPFDTLETQRRMHPRVSELIRSTLYPSLDDGGDVAKYPEVYGLKRRLFWLHHESPEDQAAHPDPATTSHTNSFEIEMTIALVQHLVRQGTYGPDDIAVITPYLAQLGRLRREMARLFEISVSERDMEDLEALDADKPADKNEVTQPHKPLTVKTTLLKSIRLATVDNFQGEEAKVVVISLVRSNDANKCGFLSTSNRINVLLSRAQHGMYLIGNANTYKHVNMWAKVLEILGKKGNIGTGLELQCPRHPTSDVPLLASKADDFLRLAPEGGCIRPCDRRLACGHSCINRCHHEILHNAVKCLEPCPRPKKGCQHPCRLVCGDPCKPRCDEFLRNLDITLACGHKISSAPCWQAQNPATIVCKQTVQKTVPGCGHMVDVPCHIDISVDSYRCGKMCLDPQPCGHPCRSPCYQCKARKGGKITNTNHGACTQPCGRNYTTCRHACQQKCHGKAPCPLCPTPCEVRCSHSRCSKKCHEPCVPCAEKTCSSSCTHSQCTMPCAAPCDWIPCSKRCEKTLECGHQCPSVCGETCPSVKYCQTCCAEAIKSHAVDYIIGMEYHEVNLDEDPCIFPDCGHFTTMINMDGIMSMKYHYKMSAEDKPTALASVSKPFSMKEVKVCPTCRGPLRNIARYGRIVRRAMLDEATKKFIAWSETEHAKLANSLLDLEERISKSQPPQASQQSQNGKKIFSTGRLKQLQLIRDWVGGARYDEALRLWNKVNAFIGQVRREEQPFQRVQDFVRHAAQQHEVPGDFVFDESVIQNKGHLQASSLSLKCDVIIISDFMRLQKDLLTTRPKIALDFSLQMTSCKTLMERAKETMHPRQEAEARIYFAQFCAFSRALTLAEESEEEDSNARKKNEFKEQGSGHLVAARELVEEYPRQCEGLIAEIEATEKMLRDSVFYEKVSTEEMRAVYKAMAGEFYGTGHWYTCQNGHPFTVGECGMPMQAARCPECGAPVGGANHAPAEGVQHADDIERLAYQMDGVAIR